MIYRARSQTVTLILALAVPLLAVAEEQKPSGTQAKVATAVAKPDSWTPSKNSAAEAAAKVEPTSKTEPASKPAAPVATVKPAAAEPAVKPEATAKPSAATPPAATAKPVEKAAVTVLPEIPVPQRLTVRPHKKPAPRHVAMTAKETPPVPAAPAPPLHWSYEGEKTGPQAWAKLAPEFARCGSGDRQSPIDIRDGMKVDLEPIVFEYRPSGFKVVDNGHAIQANVGGWNTMRLMGRRFKLVQFHFHTPSEEVIDGRQYEMVVHLVHKDSDGRLAVVAVLVDAGTKQSAIQAVLNNLPLKKDQEVTSSTSLDMMQMLPEKKAYFTYMGSLTTPPCTEDVLWVVMKQPLQASSEQLNLFARLYPMNARPIQSAGNRMIKESN